MGAISKQKVDVIEIKPVAEKKENVNKPQIENPVTRAYKDCLIIFKTLCQYSMKELPPSFVINCYVVNLKY